ncbi:hydantoinase B/oxoprolinase family protein [Oceaniglobus trochenteri]|uniref:hydantoinase B/oxoprolinase family protein n=1 Tax=Oceaniglobus trochenteri TaxID=2763260 RepID=UPI001CFFB2E1|nr:hydantoinase B/oxoprolinase family protein [Oceaniglobus trochenteri]
MSEIDTLHIEIIRQRLVSIAEESEATILRTAYSSTVAEAADFSAGLFDAQRRLIAQTPRALGAFIGILGTALRRLLEDFPPETLSPGDVIITNDPWIGAGHLPDIVMIRPIFYRERIVGYSANVAHVADLGGKVSAEAADMFEEGLSIPPIKFYEKGKMNRTVLAFIAANSRLPTHVNGDLHALNTANKMAAQRVCELMDEYGLDELTGFSDQIQSRAEKAVRARIREVPDGVYTGSATSDGADAPLKLNVAITVKGDTVTVDYAGTSDQVRWGLNAPFNLTRAETLYALRIAFAPDVPVVDGAVAPFTVTAPEGCVLNPLRPAPTMIRVTVVQNVYGAVFKALAPLVPEHIAPNRLHAHFGGIWAVRFRGTYPKVPAAYANGGPPQVNATFTEAYFANGGAGALPDSDGHSTISMPVNCANIPVEIMEARAPILFEYKRQEPDTGGPGKYRGGVGQAFAIKVLSDVPVDFVPGTNDRVDNPPFGLFGGQAGRGGGFWIEGQKADRRRSQRMEHGQVVTVVVPGGGGCGNPSERDRAAIAEDLKEGLITSEGAARDYDYRD